MTAVLAVAWAPIAVPAAAAVVSSAIAARVAIRTVRATLNWQQHENRERRRVEERQASEVRRKDAARAAATAMRIMSDVGWWATTPPTADHLAEAREAITTRARDADQHLSELAVWHPSPDVRYFASILGSRLRSVVQYTAEWLDSMVTGKPETYPGLVQVEARQAHDEWNRFQQAIRDDTRKLSPELEGMMTPEAARPPRTEEETAAPERAERARWWPRRGK